MAAWPLRVRPANGGDVEPWLRMRQALLPEDKDPEREMRALLRDATQACFVAELEGAMVGFVEVSTRPWADGCDTSPVAYVEALYVVPGARRRGAARALMDAAADWATRRGLRELASDALFANVASRRVHKRLGFDERERLVVFRRVLATEARAGTRAKAARPSASRRG